MNLKETYTDREFWNHNPICETADGDVYSISGICYKKKFDGKWHKIDDDDDDF